MRVRCSQAGERRGVSLSLLKNGPTIVSDDDLRDPNCLFHLEQSSGGVGSSRRESSVKLLPVHPSLVGVPPGGGPLSPQTPTPI